MLIRVVPPDQRPLFLDRVTRIGRGLLLGFLTAHPMLLSCPLGYGLPLSLPHLLPLLLGLA